MAAAEPGFGEIGLDGERLVTGGEGFVITPELQQRVAPAEPGFGKIGFKPEAWS